MAQMNSDLHQTSQPCSHVHTVFHFLKTAVYTLKLPSKGTGRTLISRQELSAIMQDPSFFCLCSSADLVTKTHQCRQYRVCKYLVRTRLSPVNICEQQIKLFAICMQCAAFFHSQWPFAGLSWLKDKIWQQRLLRNLICCPQSRNEANPIIDG